MWTNHEFGELTNLCEQHVTTFWDILTKEEINVVSYGAPMSTAVSNLQNRVIIPKQVIKNPLKVIFE